MIPDKPVDENERLAELKSYHILDTPPEADFDEITKLASVICETPISLITLVDADRQWFKSNVGLDLAETTRDIAFCSYALHQDELMVVPDAAQDDRFRNNPLVTRNPDIRFYAGMPLVTRAGHALGTLCVLDTVPRQITEQQKVALKVLGRQVIKLLELRQRNLQLQKLAEVNVRLLSVIGHDLRAPFSSLSGVLTIFESNELSIDEFKSLIPEIKKTVDSGSNLLENLLEWASSQINGPKINKEKVGIKELIDKIISENSTLLREKGNTTVVKVDSGYALFADRKMTEFIIRNLLLNANKFTEKGSISFSATPAGEFLEIQVKDTGIGIKEHVLKGLFSWSERTSSDGTRGEKGSGLGLLFCKEFVEAHGGQIGVTSKVNQSTTFSFTLPVYSS